MNRPPNPHLLYPLLPVLFMILALPGNTHAQSCDPAGNVLIFTNYDGGELNINIDADIPNLKIGICSYEPVIANIGGAFVGNVTKVLYAGFNSAQNNNHCGLGVNACSINGVPASVQTILTYPPVTTTNPNGWNFGIVCAYTCDVSNNQGGCNTIDQVVDYFDAQLGGVRYALVVQYGCWEDCNSFSVSQLAGVCCQPQSNSSSLAISYPGSPFCQSLSTPQPVSISGSNQGSFSATPAGLLLNSATGAVTPQGSAPGTYTVTYTSPACQAVASTTVVIGNAPAAPAVSEDATYCPGEAIAPLSAQASGGGVLTWYDNPSLTNPIGSGSSLVINPGIGVNNYYVTETVQGCVSNASLVQITLEELEPPQVSQDTAYCQGALLAPLSAQASQGGVLTWYDDPSLATPIGVGASLSINPGAGSNSYYVTESALGCVSQAAVVSVVINVPVAASVDYGAVGFCQSQEILTPVITGPGGGTFKSTPPGLNLDSQSGAVDLGGSAPGNYLLVYEVPDGACAEADTLALDLYPVPEVQVGAIDTACDKGVTLIAYGTGLFTWNNGQIGDVITADVEQEGAFCVEARLGPCIDTACIQLLPIPACCPVYVPDAFSPDGNGINDDFGPFTSCEFESFEMLVFNRWGGLVFRSTDPAVKWQGIHRDKDCAPGAYTYYISYGFSGQPPLELKGAVMLLR